LYREDVAIIALATDFPADTDPLPRLDLNATTVAGEFIFDWMDNMPMSIEIDGKTLETDNEGYLLDPALWNERAALEIARLEAIDMTAAHWEVVNFVRDYYETHQVVPENRTLLKTLRERHGKDTATRRYVQQLFPYGFGQQACKIAGMRKPLKLLLDL